MLILSFHLNNQSSLYASCVVTYQQWHAINQHTYIHTCTQPFATIFHSFIEELIPIMQRKSILIQDPYCTATSRPENIKNLYASRSKPQIKNTCQNDILFQLQAEIIQTCSSTMQVPFYMLFCMTMILPGPATVWVWGQGLV